MFEKKKEALKEKNQQTKQQVEEVKEDLLEKVNGAGDPFDKIPRAPTQPIDEDLRENA